MGIEENNLISPEDDKVSRLIGSLNRVEAPKDFDFKVKARIAQGKPAVSWFPTPFRVAVPVGLSLLFGGYFGYNAVYSGIQTNVPAIAAVQNELVVPKAVEQPVVSAQPSEQTLAKQTDTKFTNPSIPLNETVIKPNSLKPSKERPGGGSYEESLTQRRTILPRGFNQTERPVADPNASNQNTKVPAKEILNILGIEATFDGTSWKVNSASANSMAERSGIKAGDVIEAINGQQLVEKTSFPNRFNGRSLRVKRDGQTMQIDLKH